MSDESSRSKKQGVFVEAKFADYKGRLQSGPKAQLSTATKIQAPIADSFEMSLEKALLPYFKDLMALDSIFEKFTKNLTVFLNRTEEHSTFNFWSGKTLSGKTTLAKRLCGQEGYAPFAANGSKTFYHDCFSIKDNFENIRKEWMDKTKVPNNSVIFIDEIEKCLDERHKLVDEVFAKKIRKLFEDLSRTRKLFFVFISQESPNRENVQRLLDMKLTSLTDYSFKFPEWTTENLLNIILETVDSRGYKIDPQAAAELAVHCSQHGMVLELQGVLQLIDVELRRSGETMIGESLVKRILKSRS